MAVDPQLVEFEKLLEEANARFGTFNASMTALETGIKSGMRADAKRTVVTENLTKRQTEVSQSFSALKEEINKNKKSSSDARKSIDELVRSQSQQLEAIDKTYPALKDQTNQIRAQIAAQVQQIGGTLKLKSTIEGLSAGVVVGSKVIGQLGSAAASLIRGYQSGANDIELATSATTTFYSTIGSVSTSVGDALSGAGAAATQFGNGTSKTSKSVRGLGLAAEGVGLAFSAFGKVTSAIAKEVMPILGAELNKAFNSFNAINSSGAMFADGLTGMVKAAGNSQLTLTEFSDVLKSSSPALASLGIGVTDAAKRMGEVGVVMRREGITTSLKNLGLTAKEQAEAVAATMAQMRQGGSQFSASNEVVAAQTQKYAENLKIIAAITGEDAKKQEAKVRDEANRLAFQQALTGKSTEEQSNILDAMKNMSDAQRKAFEETVVFGNAVTPASAALMQQSEGFANIVSTAANDFQSGTLDATKMRQTQAQFGEQAMQDLINNKGIAMAGFAGVGGLADELEKAMGAELQFRKDFTPQAIAAAEAAAKASEKTTDPLTVGVEKAAQAGRDLATAIQTSLLDSKVLSSFADEVGKTTSFIAGKINEFAGGKPDSASGTAANQEKSWFQSWVDNGGIGNALKAAGGLTTVAAAVTSPAAATGIGAVIPGGLATIAGALEAAGFFAQMIGYAEGGIASGPDTGYMAKLHGTEAVLPENLTSMLTDVAENKMDESSRMNLINSIVSKNNNQDVNTSANSDSLMNILITKVDDLIYATQDVARYTKETSVRIM
jgi:predicted  nucleic acid-binding Zn-ribbon protein